MALRAELVGPYCLILVTSSVCAVRRLVFRHGPCSARMSLLELTAAALGCAGATLCARLKGLSVNN